MITLVVLLSILSISRGDLVRQCTCQELDECKATVIQAVVPCVAQCKAPATTPASAADVVVVDPADVLSCLQREKEQNNASCLAALKSEICSNAANQTISSADAFSSQTGQKLVGKILQTRARNAINNKASDVAQFISSSLGVDAAGFKTCMTQCVKDTNPLACLESKNCSLKRPSSLSLLSTLPACKTRRNESKQRVCQCIKDLGATNVQC